MGTNDIITLVWPLDEETEEKTEVFAEVGSVGQSEFFAAAQNGLKAQFQFKVWPDEYSNQPYVEYNGQRYSIYRTYEPPGQKVELYAEVKIGA